MLGAPERGYFAVTDSALGKRADDQDRDAASGPFRSPDVGGDVVRRKRDRPAGRSWAARLLLVVVALLAAGYFVPILILMLDR